MAISEEIQATPPNSSKKANPESKWILVVDNKPVIKDIFERFLWRDDFYVLMAANCDEAIDQARLMPVSLIVLNVDLPGSQGVPVRAKLKHEAVTARLPLLLISLELPKHDLQTMADGRDGFLSMPFSAAEVREVVSRLLGPAA